MRSPHALEVGDRLRTLATRRRSRRRLRKQAPAAVRSRFELIGQLVPPADFLPVPRPAGRGVHRVVACLRRMPPCAARCRRASRVGRRSSRWRSSHGSPPGSCLTRPWRETCLSVGAVLLSLHGRWSTAAALAPPSSGGGAQCGPARRGLDRGYALALRRPLSPAQATCAGYRIAPNRATNPDTNLQTGRLRP